MPEVQGLAVSVSGWAHLQLELLAGTREQLLVAIRQDAVRFSGLSVGDLVIDKSTGQPVARILTIPLKQLTIEVSDEL